MPHALLRPKRVPWCCGRGCAHCSQRGMLHLLSKGVRSKSQELYTQPLVSCCSHAEEGIELEGPLSPLPPIRAPEPSAADVAAVLRVLWVRALAAEHQEQVGSVCGCAGGSSGCVPGGVSTHEGAGPTAPLPTGAVHAYPSQDGSCPSMHPPNHQLPNGSSPTLTTPATHPNLAPGAHREGPLQHLPPSDGSLSCGPPSPPPFLLHPHPRPSPPRRPDGRCMRERAPAAAAQPASSGAALGGPARV